MNACHEVDRLVTPFVDGECATEEGAFVTAHLRQCVTCRERVKAETTTRRLLHAHVTIARRAGAVPAWRPRVWRLGRPGLPAHSGAILLVAVAASALFVAGAWLRPVEASAIGVIGDSSCQRTHPVAAQSDADERACILRCISRGAHFVLMTDTQIFQISNQELPELAAFANVRVRVTGAVSREAFTISSIAAADR